MSSGVSKPLWKERVGTGEKNLDREVTSELKKRPSSLLQHTPVPTTVTTSFAKAGSGEMPNFRVSTLLSTRQTLSSLSVECKLSCTYCTLAVEYLIPGKLGSLWVFEICFNVSARFGLIRIQQVTEDDYSPI